MTKISVKVKVKLKAKGAAGVLCLLLGVTGVHYAQPYAPSSEI